MSYQRALGKARRNLHWVVATLVITFAVYSEFWRSLTPLVIYLTTLLIGAAMWAWQRRHHVEQRYYDYRVLAEALRVQHVWSATGMPQSVASAYLRKHRGELQWVRFVIRGYASDRSVVSAINKRREVVAETGDAEALVEGESWIRDQRAYFERSAIKHGQLLRRAQQMAGILYVVGIGAAFGGVVAQITETRAALQVLVFLMALAPALAGTLASWIQHAAIAEEAADRTRMARLFDSALKEWTARPGHRRALISELGVESLHENADWLLLHRSRPLEAPLGPG